MRITRLVVGAAYALGLCLTLTVPGRADDPGGDSLKSLIVDLRAAIAAGDRTRAAGIVRGLMPDAARIGKALGPGATEPIRGQIVGAHEKIPKDNDALLAELIAMAPEETVVKVHGSTGLDIALYKEGTPAFAEFPGATQVLALDAIIEPSMTFYEVEFLEPGKEAGMKYHLFYWDGSAWTMLGPIWRMIK